jgi:hypothetical protein
MDLNYITSTAWAVLAVVCLGLCAKSLAKLTRLRYELKEDRDNVRDFALLHAALRLYVGALCAHNTLAVSWIVVGCGLLGAGFVLAVDLILRDSPT